MLETRSSLYGLILWSTIKIPSLYIFCILCTYIVASIKIPSYVWSSQHRFYVYLCQLSQSRLLWEFQLMIYVSNIYVKLHYFSIFGRSINWYSRCQKTFSLSFTSRINLTNVVKRMSIEYRSFSWISLSDDSKQSWSFIKSWFF